MFQIIDIFFKEHDLQWKTCGHICTDGAAAMTGSVKGLFGHVKKVNPDIKWLHCIIHREALASKRMSPDLIKLVQAHLSKLCMDFNQYFQDIEKKSEGLEWVRNPFIVSESCSKLPARLQEHLMDLSCDQGLKMTYDEKTLTEFWCDVEKEYPELGKHALIELLPFGSTYMCEVTFSALTHIKTKQRNRLDVENSLVADVSTLGTQDKKGWEPLN
uniref:Uncharacterized protein n=1 Tax=Gouania willdenowi TaxID=441366 RepID=A0A8C5E7Z6_GOUWI